MKINYTNLFRNITIILFAVLVLVATYNLNDYRVNKAEEITKVMRQRGDNLALSLSQVNNLLSSTNNIVLQINRVLENNGYPMLVRDLEKEKKLEEQRLDSLSQRDLFEKS